MHQSLNPDLKHSSTEGPISINNHSVTLTAPANSCFYICFLTYLLTYLLTICRAYVPSDVLIQERKITEVQF